MGRKINPDHRAQILELVKANNGLFRAANIANLLNLHPQEVARVLASLENEPTKQLCEDDRGFLSRFTF